MLVKLIPNQEEIDKFIEFANYRTEEWLIRNDLDENWLKSLESFDYYYKPMNSVKEFSDAPDGFYFMSEIFYYMADDEYAVIGNEGKVEEFGFLTDDKPEFGICDSWQNIIDYYPELNDPEEKFFVIMTPFYKKDEKPHGLKWSVGEYIGNQNPQTNYLYNEPEIELVFLFNICKFFITYK